MQLSLRHCSNSCIQHRVLAQGKVWLNLPGWDIRKRRNNLHWVLKVEKTSKLAEKGVFISWRQSSREWGGQCPVVGPHLSASTSTEGKGSRRS